MKICVVGLGYVGLSNSLLLAIDNDVIGVDIVPERISQLNKRISPLKDDEIESYLKTTQAKFSLDLKDGRDSELFIVSTPTDYNTDNNYFDTSSVEDVITKIIKINKDALILIKSTIPIGFVEQFRKKMNNNNILFSPEFLREGKALYDNLYPSRIVVGERSTRAKKIAKLFAKAAKNNPEILLTGPTEAESIKLFANTCLAKRVAFFNELDTFCACCGLNAKDVIEGVSLDPRIGNFYNNPSFGYGGYCLPKDTKQLRANYADIQQSLMSAIIKSNDLRKEFIASEVLKSKPNTVGIYKLAMKSSSDNFRASAILDIMDIIKRAGVEILVHDPTIKEDTFRGAKVISGLDRFKDLSDIILANRLDDKISDVMSKVYTRDIYQCD